MSWKPPKNALVQARNKLGDSKPALWAISTAVCWKARYFRTIRPTFTRFDPGHVEATIPLRTSVTNHIGSVHAIAMCNAAELVGGTAMELSVHRDLRWIPVGMEVEYLKIARTDLRAVCKLDTYDWTEPQDVISPVEVFDANDQLVFRAKIRMRLSARKSTKTAKAA